MFTWLLVLASPAFAASKVQVLMVDPPVAVAGQTNTLIIHGNKLSDIKFCSYTPVTGNGLDVNQSDVNFKNLGASDDACMVRAIRGDGTLEVRIHPRNGSAVGRYILEFGKAKIDNNAPTLDAETVISVRSADATKPSPSDDLSDDGIDGGSYYRCNGPSTKAPEGKGPALTCSASLSSETEVSDNYGSHVNRTYFAIQLHVSNNNSQCDFLLRDIVLTLPDGRKVSSRIRRLAQGVAVKGKYLDKRSVWYNITQASSGLYGGLTVFSWAGTAFKDAGNILQGAGLAGFSQIWPDTTADNVNRFNNAVFDDMNPSIVPKGNSGQSPFNVIALIPRVPELGAASVAYGSCIRASIEGTFIKTVTPVSISADSLAFQPEFVFSDSKQLDKLQTIGPLQTLNLTNDGSSPVVFNKVHIVQPPIGGASGSTVQNESKDFTIVIPPDKSTTAKFTLAAQSSCSIYVLSTPTKVGQTQGTLLIEGGTIDSEKGIDLKGFGSPFLPDFSMFPDKSTVCSLSSVCTLDLSQQQGQSFSFNIKDLRTLRISGPLVVTERRPQDVVEILCLFVP